jgi:hypothetical protein
MKRQPGRVGKTALTATALVVAVYTPLNFEVYAICANAS